MDEERRDRKGRTRQVGALPLRRDDAGAIEVLLITSRRTRRWIIPKGWPMKGKADADAAAIEALEEAGVRGSIDRKPTGTFDYIKYGEDGDPDIPMHVRVFRLKVEKVLDEWQEGDERDRQWFSAQEAATLVEEPQLQRLIADLSKTDKL